MNKIQRVSLFLRVLFQIAFVVWPIGLALYWIFSRYLIPGYADVISFIPPNIEILHPISAGDACLGFLVSLLPVGIGMTVLYFLIKLFKLYEQGKIFNVFSAQYMKKIGIWMLVGQVVGLFYDILISFVLTLHNPAGHRYIRVGFDNYDMYNTVVAVMVIVISWIMVEGYKLQEEQTYTV